MAKAHLLGKVDISCAGLRNKMLLGDIDGDGRMELVMVQPDGGIDDRYVPHQVQCVTAFNLDGELLWQKGRPDPQCGGSGSDFPAQLYDWDGDGRLELLCVMNKRFLILDGQTGEVKQSHALPGEEAHDCIIIANLSGGERATDILLKDRYRTVWALDRDFNVLWKHEGNPGHYPWVYDIDGDGRDEVMAGYTMLDHDGTVLWSCHDLEDHADCLWFGDVDGDPEGCTELVVGGSVTVMYDLQGRELWRYTGSIESQHVALGRFRDDFPGLQVAGLDRIVRGDLPPSKDTQRSEDPNVRENTTGVLTKVGKDAIFLLDRGGREIWKEDRQTPGWLTIIETLRHYDDNLLDYIFAWRRGGGVYPTLYDGWLNPVVAFPAHGYAAHADLVGSGREQVIIYDDQHAHIFGSRPMPLTAVHPGVALPQPKRLYSSTLYPGGEYI